jgi:protein dithiol:quinone oxidoreductase
MKHFHCIGFLFAFGLIAAALMIQNSDHLTPCPLCIMQRVGFILIALLFLVFALLPKRSLLLRVHGVCLIFISGASLAVALRQIYLQHLPVDQLPACGPGLNYLLQLFSWSQTLSMVFHGSGECAAVDWRFLGLSMADWSALWLLFFCLWGVSLLYFGKKRYET